MSDPSTSPRRAASSGHGSATSGHANRQSVIYCPYCAEETLFPLEGGGWECRSCLRAFSVTFLGLASASRHADRERS
jgi:ribosomal protein L37AE/L43A